MMHDFFLALGFFTRIPVPSHPNFTEQALRRSAVYFPLVGLVVGSVLGFVYFATSQLWASPIAILITLACSFILTGGFHEDGWADTFDGLGGAFKRVDKLRIMTDSRLGTYGSLALWALLSIKAFTLFELAPAQGFFVFLVLHSLSRWASMSSMVWLDYVRVEPSKAKPVVQQLSLQRWLVSGLFALPMLLFLPWMTILALLSTALVVTLAWHLILKWQLGGYTGDTLGASQQLNELCLGLIWLAL